MDDKPLEVSIEAGVPSERLLKDIEATLRDDSRTHALPGSNGVLLRAVWEADLDRALQRCAKALSYDLQVSPPRVRYLDGPPRMEPVMEVRVTVPERFAGDVVGEMTQRRAWMENLDRVDINTLGFVALVPLDRLLGYANVLRVMTEDQGTLEVTFHDYHAIS